MAEEDTRDQIEEIIINELPTKEAAIETIIEEEEVKPKPEKKTKSQAKQIKITKQPIEEPVEPIVEEPIVEVVGKPNKVYKLKYIVRCPDCNMEMTQHTLKHIHKRRGLCKADKAEPEKTPEPEQQKQNTKDIVNDYTKQNPDTISNYLRNERAMKAQRKQMNARSLLNDA